MASAAIFACHKTHLVCILRVVISNYDPSWCLLKLRMESLEVFDKIPDHVF